MNLQRLPIANSTASKPLREWWATCTRIVNVVADGVDGGVAGGLPDGPSMTLSSQAKLGLRTTEMTSQHEKQPVTLSVTAFIRDS